MCGVWCVVVTLPVKAKRSARGVWGVRVEEGGVQYSVQHAYTCTCSTSLRNTKGSVRILDGKHCCELLCGWRMCAVVGGVAEV